MFPLCTNAKHAADELTQFRRSSAEFSGSRTSFSTALSDLGTLSETAHVRDRQELEPPICIPFDRCPVCERYNHGQVLIPGVSIQCVNADEYQYHLLDFFLKPDECSTVVNLCSASDCVQSFTFGNKWRGLCRKLYYLCMMGRESDVRFVLEHFQSGNMLRLHTVYPEFARIAQLRGVHQLISQIINESMYKATYVAELMIGL